MATVEYTVAASADDANETSVGSVITNGGSTGGLDATNEWAGARWEGVTIPDGATIDAAWVEVSVTSAALDEPQHTIYFENADAPSAFAALSNNITSRTRTTASVVWDSADLGAVNGVETYFQTASLVPIIEELMAARSYASGRAMVFLIQGGADAARDLSFTLYDGNASFAPKLHIEYTVGGTPPAEFDADITATATATASLVNAIRLAGALTASGTTQAGLLTAIRLAGALNASSTVAAQLTTAITMLGALSASGTVTGALLAQIQLAGALTSTAVLTGDLDGGIVAAQFAANVSATAAVLGDLLTEIRLAGGLSAAVTAEGALTATGTAALLAGALVAQIIVLGGMLTRGRDTYGTNADLISDSGFGLTQDRLSEVFGPGTDLI